MPWLVSSDKQCIRRLIVFCEVEEEVFVSFCEERKEDAIVLICFSGSRGPVLRAQLILIVLTFSATIAFCVFGMSISTWTIGIFLSVQLVRS